MKHEKEKSETAAPFKPRAPRSLGMREFVLLAVGFGCMVGYARMVSLGFVGYFSDGMMRSGDPWYALRAGSGLVMLVVLACNGWFRWFRIGTKTLAATIAAALGATIAFAAGGAELLGPVIAAVSGCAIAVLMYAWMLLLGSFETRAIVGATLAGLPICGAIVMGVPLLDDALGLVVVVAAAFVAGAAAVLLDVDLDACVPDGPLRGNAAMRVPWLTFVMVLACGILGTVLYGIADQLTWLYDWSYNRVAFGVAAVATIGSTAFLMMRSHTWIHRVWVPPFALLVAALVFACFSIRESIQIAVGLMLAAVFCAHFLHWTIFPSMFSTLRIPRAFLAAVVLICVNGSLASAVGDAIGAALPHSMQNLGGVAGIMAIVLGAVFALTLFAYHRVVGTVGFWPATPGAVADRGVRASDEDDEDEGEEIGGARAYSHDSIQPEGAFVASESAAREDEPLELDGFGAEPLSDDDARLLEQHIESPTEEDRVRAVVESSAQPAKTGGEEAARKEEPPAHDEASEGEQAEPDAAASNPLDLLKSRIEDLSVSSGLTPREEEVAFLTAQGFSCAYIAEKLFVSNSTVRFHQKNLYRKLDVHSRNELIEVVNDAGDERA